jgi:hypothetical protein
VIQNGPLTRGGESRPIMAEIEPSYKTVKGHLMRHTKKLTKLASQSKIIFDDTVQYIVQSSSAMMKPI